MKRRNSKSKPKPNHTLDKFVIRSKLPLTSLEDPLPAHPIKFPHNSGLDPSDEPSPHPFLYPKYPQFREYQFEIAQSCITHNTLVCLPTGLGKTHIASVVMLNFANWFPEGKIFFLAPTRPLVEQQSSALRKFGQYIEESNVSSVKSQMPVLKRKEIYERKRIFFCTPQILQNDLRAERISPRKIVLIIFDEAHKATGNYSYTQVVKLMEGSQTGFRIVGLSATPGNQIDKIQQVITNLQIAKMIVKQEDDPNVARYMKGKQVTPIFIPSSSIIRETEQILDVHIKNCMSCLQKLNAADKYLLNIRNVSVGVLHLIRQQYYERAKFFSKDKSEIISNTLKFLYSLISSKESLRTAGYRDFIKNFMREFLEYEKAPSEYARELKFCPQYYEMVVRSEGWIRLKQLFSTVQNIGSHPKLQKLKSILTQFFSKKESVEKQSKVIIFAHLRTTCFEIKQYLESTNFDGLFLPEMFFGQAKTTIETDSEEGSMSETLYLPQKEQSRLISRFKQSDFNILISTSIGEEGLDIGEVDAIFCYDGGMSLVRLVQRMGRTGRKRDGSVFILLTEGKETEDYNKALKKTKKFKQILPTKFKYYSFNPSMLKENSQICIQYFDEPPPLSPTCPARKDSSEKKVKAKKRKQKPTEPESDAPGLNSMSDINELRERRKQIAESYLSSESLALDDVSSRGSSYFRIEHNLHYTPTQQLLLNTSSDDFQFPSVAAEQSDEEALNLSELFDSRGQQTGDELNNSYDHYSREEQDSIDSSEAIRIIQEQDEADTQSSNKSRTNGAYSRRKPHDT